MFVSFCYISFVLCLLTETTAGEGIDHLSLRGKARSIEDPGLPDGRPEPIDHNEWEISGRRHLGSILSRLWDTHENDIVTIPYYIRQSKYNQEYGFSQEAYDTITSALVDLEARSHVIRFRWWRPSDDDYILFKRASSGCSSYIGKVRLLLSFEYLSYKEGS